MSSSPVISVGIDPGWKTTGISIVEKKESELHLVHSETLNPFELGLIESVNYVKTLIKKPCQLTLERYVGYSGVTSKDSEHILMMIGALHYGLISTGNVVKIDMYRAIDWKTELVKLLFKKRGFNNPSLKLDKKFSVAAAKACINISKLGSNHEADAICMASLPFIRLENDLPIQSMGGKTGGR